MRATLTIDDALYEKALEMADTDMDKADIFRVAMKIFVRVQAAKRLAALGALCLRFRMCRGGVKSLCRNECVSRYFGVDRSFPLG